jgi:flagellar motor switch protein FliN/FliY
MQRSIPGGSMIQHPADTLTDIDALADVPVVVEVRLGGRAATLEEIARLEIGGTIPLGKPAGQALDVFAGNLLLASAEPVLVEDRLAIRITDIFTRPPAAPVTGPAS